MKKKTAKFSTSVNFNKIAGSRDLHDHCDQILKSFFFIYVLWFGPLLANTASSLIIEKKTKRRRKKRASKLNWSSAYRVWLEIRWLPFISGIKERCGRRPGVCICACALSQSNPRSCCYFFPLFYTLNKEFSSLFQLALELFFMTFLTFLTMSSLFFLTWKDWTITWTLYQWRDFRNNWKQENRARNNGKEKKELIDRSPM